MSKPTYKELEKRFKKRERAEAEHKKGEEEKVRLLHDFGERVKELNCLYSLSKLVEQESITLEKIFMETVDIIPLSLQYPDITCSRIVFEGHAYKTANFKKTKWKQSAKIKVHAVIVGEIEIFYLEKKPVLDEGPFLKEERNLIDAIAERLGGVIEHRQAEEALREENEFNLALFEHNPIETIAVDIEGRITNFNLAKKKSGDRLPAIGDVMYRDYAGRHEIDMYTELLECIRIGKPKEFYEKKYGEKFLSINIVPFPHGAVITSQDITERKRAEEALKESEEKYRKIIENIYDIIYSSYADGTIYFISPNILSITGYKPEEIIGHNIMEFVHPDDREHVLSDFEKTIKTGEEFPTILRLSRKDGSYFYVEEFGKVVRDGDKIVGVTGVLRDITERKKIEEALQDSELKYRTTIDSMSDAIHVIDNDLRISLTNSTLKQWVENLGLENDIIGLTVFEAFPFLPDKVRDEYNQVFKNGKTLITEESAKFGDREIITETRKIPIFKEEQISGIVTIIRDITERKRSEDKLRESEELFRNLAEKSPNIIYVYNMDIKRIVYANKICEELMEYKNGEFYSPNFDFLALITPESRDIIMENLSRHMRGEEVVPYEFTIITKEGRRIEVIGSTKLIQYKGQRAILGIVTDITEHKRAEEKLKHTQKELEIKAKNLEETNIALKVLLKHQDTEKNIMENNILTSLKTLVLPYLEKIKIGTSDERQKTYVNIIETNLSEITKPFASKLTESYSKLTPTEIQITSLIRENKTAKDIAKILDISVSTVFFHRENIRIKLGLKNKKTNLQSYLQSIPND